MSGNAVQNRFAGKRAIQGEISVDEYIPALKGMIIEVYCPNSKDMEGMEKLAALSKGEMTEENYPIYREEEYKVISRCAKIKGDEIPLSIPEIEDFPVGLRVAIYELIGEGMQSPLADSPNGRGQRKR